MVKIKKFVKNGCRPCAVVSVILANMEIDAPIEETNIDELSEADFEATIAKYKLNSAPTLVFERNGIEMERIVGITSEDAIIDALETAKEAR